MGSENRKKNRDLQREREKEEKRLKNRKGDPNTIKISPDGPPKAPKPKPKPKGSNMQSYDPMGAGLRQIKARGGDNLTHLADRAGTTVGTIMKLNSNITDEDKIAKGQSIRVPANTKGMKSGGKPKAYGYGMKNGGKPRGWGLARSRGK